MPLGADVLDAVHCGFVTVDRDLRISDVNEAACRWVGKHRDDLLGAELAALLVPASVVYWQATVEPLLEQQGHAWDLALELRGEKPVAVLVNARREAGTTTCLLFPFSERRRYERAMRAAQDHARQQQIEIKRLLELDAFRRDFVNSAAHQIATPMTPLQIHFHLLQQALAGDADPKVQRAIDAMKTNIDKLAKFAAALVASADIEAGRVGMKITPVSLAESLPLFVEQWRRRIKPHQDIRVHAAAATIAADADALASCLTHLLENAAKFSPADSKIHVRVQPGPRVRIAVHDEGRGIEPERLKDLARPFVQAHDPHEVTALGAGLGLHIVDGLMKAQGGRLILESEGAGRGTTAILEFPAGADEAHATAAELRRAMKPSFG